MMRNRASASFAEQGRTTVRMWQKDEKQKRKKKQKQTIMGNMTVICE